MSKLFTMVPKQRLCSRLTHLSKTTITPKIITRRFPWHIMFKGTNIGNKRMRVGSVKNRLTPTPFHSKLLVATGYFKIPNVQSPMRSILKVRRVIGLPPFLFQVFRQKFPHLDDRVGQSLWVIKYAVSFPN